MNPPDSMGSAEFATPLTSVPTAGVASLDSPLVQQTKSEIRALAAEIAELAHSNLTKQEFFDAFLPRLTVAMGATGGAIWEVGGDQIVLAAQQVLPSALLDRDQPTLEHERVLKCAVAEGQPILVPPKNVVVDADRPTNPLDDALILVPVRTADAVSHLVQVVQRPSGGPATQRGYLRFVAQMADLVADFLRRDQLRQMSAQEARLAAVENWYTRIASSDRFSSRCQAVADGLADLFAADQVIVLRSGRRPRTLAVSAAPSVDPRSEASLAACALAQQLGGEQLGNATWLHATERRTREGEGDGGPEIADTASSYQPLVDQLCGALRVRRLLLVTLQQEEGHIAFLGFASSTTEGETHEPASSEWAGRVWQALGALMQSPSLSPRDWRSWLHYRHGHSANKGSYRWVGRAVIAALLTAIALFPVPQQIAATAILRPVQKRPYYAPSDARVTSVYVEEGDDILPDQPLMQLASRELQSEIDTLTGELQQVNERTVELAEIRNRSDLYTSVEMERFEGELAQLHIRDATLRAKLKILEGQSAELLIKATEEGRVASWGLRNRLLNRPVAQGSPLVTTYRPEGDWLLEVQIPDYRSGLVDSSMQGGDRSAKVRFSLSSHPDQLLEASLFQLSSQVIQVTAEESSSKHVVLGKAQLDPAQLPLRKDGAIARANIECGSVPAIWLVARDAYWAISSRIQLMF